MSPASSGTSFPEVKSTLLASVVVIVCPARAYVPLSMSLITPNIDLLKGLPVVGSILGAV
jgi:hypothetical protein